MAPMKPKLRKERLYIHLLEADGGAGTDAKRYLRKFDFHNVKVHKDINKFRKEIAEGKTDVHAIIGCLDMQGGAFRELITEIRNGDFGYNPFLPLIATSWNLGDEDSELINSLGVDSYLSHPVSPIDMHKHLEGTFTKRRTFVAVHDYIGPDRRHEKERHGLGLSVHVPNDAMLKTRFVTMHNVKDSVQVAWEKLMLNQAISRIFDSGVTVRLAVDRLGNKEPVSNVLPLFYKALSMCQAAQGKVPEEEYPGVNQVVGQLEEVIQKFLNDHNDLDSLTLKLMMPLSQAVCMSVRPNQDVRDVANEIDRWIQKREQ